MEALPSVETWNATRIRRRRSVPPGTCPTWWRATTRPSSPRACSAAAPAELLAPFAVIGATLLKFKTALLALLKLKFLAASGSMLVSVAGYAVFWGWRFAAGFVVLLLIHELGHVLEARRQGLATGGVYFIPFLGAVMLLKQQSKDAAQGRLAGARRAAPRQRRRGGDVGGRHRDGLGPARRARLHRLPAQPVQPHPRHAARRRLGDGRVPSLFWAFGLAGVVVLFAIFPNPILLLVAALGAWELWKRWKRRGHDDAAYRHRVRPASAPRSRSCTWGSPGCWRSA